MLVMVAFMTLAVSQTAQAIEDPNPKGTVTLGARCGFFPGVGANIVGDYTLVDSWWKGHFTVGGYLGFNTRAWHHTYAYLNGTADYVERWTNLAVMPRATYGLNITDDFEVHVCVMLGAAYHRWTYHWENEVYDNVYNPGDSWHFIQGEGVGCRYFFTPNFGVEAEINYFYPSYMSYFNAGVTFKF